MTVIKDSKVGEAAAWPISPKGGDIPENFSIGGQVKTDDEKSDYIIMVKLFDGDPNNGYVWHGSDGTIIDHRVSEYHNFQGMEQIINKINPVTWTLHRDREEDGIKWTTMLCMDKQLTVYHRGRGPTGPHAVVQAAIQYLKARK